MTIQPKYKAFISYSRDDLPRAQALQSKLEKWRAPTRLGTPVSHPFSPVFLDKSDLATAHSLSDEIADALRQSEYLIVIASPSAKASFWVNEEIRVFRQMHGREKIRCILVDGEPDIAFPEALSDINPIAADFRPNADGENLGFSKLAAGLLGVPLNDLLRRQAKRQQQQNFRWGALAVSIIAVLSALTIWAFTMQQRAETNLIMAEDSRQDAEELIKFMLTDLRDQLDPLGQIDVLYPVADAVAEYYAQIDQSHMDADAKGQMALNFHLIGDLKSRQGLFAEAQQYVGDAYDLTEAALEADRQNESRIFEHAQSEYWRGYLAGKNDNLDEKKRRYEAYFNLSKQLVEMSPENEDWQMELGYAHHNMGVFHDNLHKNHDALESFENALGVFEGIKSNDNLRKKYEAIVNSKSYIVDNTYAISNTHDAIDKAQGLIHATDAWVNTYPDDYKAQFRSAWARSKLGYYMTLAGGREDASTTLLEANNLLEELHLYEPAHQVWLETYLLNCTYYLIYFGSYDDQRFVQLYDALSNARERYKFDSYNRNLIEKLFVTDFLYSNTVQQQTLDEAIQYATKYIPEEHLDETERLLAQADLIFLMFLKSEKQPVAKLSREPELYSDFRAKVHSMDEDFFHYIVLRASFMADDERLFVSSVERFNGKKLLPDIQRAWLQQHAPDEYVNFISTND